MPSLKFREIFFEEIVKTELGYVPSIMFAPAHLANGLFRAIGGGYYNNEAQHWAIFAKTDPLRGPNPPRTERQFERFNKHQKEALRFLNKNSVARKAIADAFAADHTVFRGVNVSSYSLSHVRHTTNDNHDRETGQWLCGILYQGDMHPAYDLLKKLLTQVPIRTAPDDLVMSDVLSVLSLPFVDESQQPKSKSLEDWRPKSLTVNDHGQFDDEIVNTIRTAFDRLAANDERSALKNGKLDTLRRMTTLGCFSVYLHLVNIGTNKERVPMFLNLDRQSRTLKRASQASYRAIIRSIESFFQTAIAKKLDVLAVDGPFRVLDNGDGSNDDFNALVRQFIEDIDWYRNPSNSKEDGKVTSFKNDCWNFYLSYRGDAAKYTPKEALAHALTDLIGLVFSAKPYDVARNLGVKIGLLTRGDPPNNKAYQLHPDLLEVLVRATVPAGEEWTSKELAQEWYKRFGLLFGGLGYENEILPAWGVPPVDLSELAANVRQLEQQLELSGYAQRYADGVVLIRVDS